MLNKNSAVGFLDGSNKDSLSRDDKDLGERSSQTDLISNPKENSTESTLFVEVGSEPEDKSRKPITVYNRRSKQNKKDTARDTNAAECVDTPTATAKPSAGSCSVDPNSNKHGKMPVVDFNNPSSVLAYSATELLMMADETLRFPRTVAENYPSAMLPPLQHSSSKVLHSFVGLNSNMKGKMVVLALEAPVNAVRNKRKNVINSPKIELSSSNNNKGSRGKGLLKRYKRNTMLGVEASSSAAQVEARVKEQENLIVISSDDSSEDTISDDRGN